MTIPRASDRRPSTTWEWRKVKLRTPVAPAGDSASATSSAQFARPRSRLKPQHLEITYRGGAESSWILVLGSRTRRFPGWMAIEDAMAALLGEADPWQ